MMMCICLCPPVLVPVGGFCIPVYIPYVLTGEWRLGRGLCKLWLVVDYMLCTASVFNIVLISFDRFLSVTRAVSPSSFPILDEKPQSAAMLHRYKRPWI